MWVNVSATNIKMSSFDQLWLNITNVVTQLRGFKLNPITTKDAIIVEAITLRGNSFKRVFYPPSAIIEINTESQWNPDIGNYSDFMILDGSLSDHPGDGFIVKWNWTIHISSSTSITRYGRKVRVDLPIDSIDLLVTDNFGMKGKATLDLT
jgi:hypothetical protein